MLRSVPIQYKHRPGARDVSRIEEKIQIIKLPKRQIPIRHHCQCWPFEGDSTYAFGLQEIEHPKQLTCQKEIGSLQSIGFVPQWSLHLCGNSRMGTQVPMEARHHPVPPSVVQQIRPVQVVTQ